MEKLLAHQADLNLRTALGLTPLQAAVLHQHSETARLLIAQGAEQDAFTQAALGDIDALRQAIAQDPARAFLPDGEGRSPLVYASAAGQLAVAKLLLAEGGGTRVERGRAGESTARQIRSPADWAASRGHAEVLNLLLDAGDPLLPNQLHAAVEHGHVAAVKVLTRHGADLEKRTQWSRTPLHLAAERGQAEVAAALIEAGADLEAKVGRHEGGGCGPPGGYRATNETPLHLAAKHAQPQIVQLLLSAGAKVDARSTRGRTPLIAAATRKDDQSKRLEVVKLLLDQGASLNAREFDDSNALECARSANNPELAELLAARGATVDAKDPNPPKTPEGSRKERGEDSE